MTDYVRVNKAVWKLIRNALENDVKERGFQVRQELIEELDRGTVEDLPAKALDWIRRQSISDLTFGITQYAPGDCNYWVNDGEGPTFLEAVLDAMAKEKSREDWAEFVKSAEPHKPSTWLYHFATLKHETKMTKYLGRWESTKSDYGNTMHPVVDTYTLPAGTKVRIVAVSRLGDVGITDDLTSNHYKSRVALSSLTPCKE